MKPDRQAIYTRVTATIAEVAGVTPADLRGETELIRDLVLDSLAMYEIVIDLEEAFDLQITDQDIEHLLTIDDAVDFISQRAKR